MTETTTIESVAGDQQQGGEREAEATGNCDAAVQHLQGICGDYAFDIYKVPCDARFACAVYRQSDDY